jgi:hypothetical protein
MTAFLSFPVPILAASAIGAFLALAPAGTLVQVAHAQRVQVSTTEFRTALEPYGEWRRSDRWGEVWSPRNRAGQWRPYSRGRWAYTENWGWYWDAADDEADWGWSVYHYGRWARDADLGWVWIPGREWAPAWVSWRRGHRHIGWAPLPPEEVIVEYREEPKAWIFVDADKFTAPDIGQYVLSPREEIELVHTTVVVNETAFTRERGFAVNPGIEPDIVAAVSPHPIHTYDVRPLVLPGTAHFRDAVEIRPDELRQGRTRIREARIEETQTTIRPAARVEEPEPLRPGERGRLTGMPPRATQLGSRSEERWRAEEQRGERGKAFEERQRAEQEHAQRGERGKAFEERQRAEQEHAQRGERGKAFEERRRPEFKSQEQRGPRAERSSALEQRGRAAESGTRGPGERSRAQEHGGEHERHTQQRGRPGE